MLGALRLDGESCFEGLKGEWPVLLGQAACMRLCEAARAQKANSVSLGQDECVCMCVCMHLYRASKASGLCSLVRLRVCVCVKW